jgi:hypothetical protein
MLTISRLKRHSIASYNDTADEAKQAAMDRCQANGGLAEYYSEGETDARWFDPSRKRGARLRSATSSLTTYVTTTTTTAARPTTPTTALRGSCSPRSHASPDPGSMGSGTTSRSMSWSVAGLLGDCCLFGTTKSALPHQGGKILAIAWEQIWELNSVKPLQISATGRKQADTRPCLTSACVTTRASQNPWDTAHNPEVPPSSGAASVTDSW